MAGQLTIDTLKASSGVLATQNGMTGIAKAWVNFNGSTAAINGSFNVSSITKSTTGAFTVNFTTALANTNYTVAGCGSLRDASDDWNLGLVSLRRVSSSVYSTTACDIRTGMPTSSVGSGWDFPVTNVIFLGA